MDTRNLILEILQNREYPLRLRAAAALALSHDLQERIDRNALFDADKLLERYASERMWSWFEARLEKLFSSDGSSALKIKAARRTLDALFSLLDRMEVLRNDWPDHVAAARRTLADYNYSPGNRESETAFETVFDDIIGEQILVYFVFTYFCGAVYNGNAYGKMKFAAAGLILIRELARAQWIENSGRLDTEELFMTAVRYSREIEHSDYNKVMMEQLLGNEELFGLEDLFSAL